MNTTNLLLLVVIALLGVPAYRAWRAKRKAPEPGLQPELAITTGLREVDVATSRLLEEFKRALDEMADEFYTALSYAYPGLYANPDQDTDVKVEFRTREPGTGKWVPLSGAAAIYAHRQGFEVERRQATVTEWEVEPNPNKLVAKRAPVSPPPVMMPTEHPAHPTGYDPKAAQLVGSSSLTGTGSHAVEVAQ